MSSFTAFSPLYWREMGLINGTDEELAGWPHPKSYSQLLNIQEQTSNV